MTNEREKLDVVEEALLDLEAAEKARLFQRTRVDGRRLLTRRTHRETVMWRPLARRLLPVAAVLVLAVGAWSWMLSVGGSLDHKGSTTSVVATSPGACEGTFQSCFGGPTGDLLASCSAHDYDTDGDVDLADFGAYQLAYAEITR